MKPDEASGLPRKARFKIGDTVVEGVVTDVRPSSDGGIPFDDEPPLAFDSVQVTVTIEPPKFQECPRCLGAKIIDGERESDGPRGCGACNGFGCVNANQLCADCGGSGCVPGSSAGELLTCDRCDGSGYIEY